MAQAYKAKTVKEGKAENTLSKTESLLGIANADIGSNRLI
jgi:hypothetical protein